MKRAFITGITGQDGSYLAELLLAKGYAVSGVVRRASTESFERIEPLRDRIHLCTNATKAKQILGWEPRVSFVEMVEKMVNADLERLQGEEQGGNESAETTSGTPLPDRRPRLWSAFA